MEKAPDGVSEADPHATQVLADLAKSGLAPLPVDQFKYLYESLNILDAKASSLLTFDGVGLAAIAIWLTDKEIPLGFHLLLDVAFALFLVSACLCLRVVWLFFPGKLLAELPQLVRLRDERTTSYGRAWYTAGAAVVVTLIATVIHTAEIFMKWLG